MKNKQRDRSTDYKQKLQSETKEDRKKKHTLYVYDEKHTL